MVNVQVAITIFVSLAIEVARDVYTGSDSDTRPGGTGMLEFRLESSHQMQRNLICLQLAAIYHRKSHLVVLTVGKRSHMMIRRIDYKVVLSVQIVYHGQTNATGAAKHVTKVTGAFAMIV